MEIRIFAWREVYDIDLAEVWPRARASGEVYRHFWCWHNEGRSEAATMGD
jgi:hypothetical protein